LWRPAWTSGAGWISRRRLNNTFREIVFMNVINRIVIAAAACMAAIGAGQAAEPGHFHPKGKMPSVYTKAFQAQQRANLPFADKTDFEEQARGFIARPDYTQIMADAGNVAWDMGRYEFLLEGEEFDSVHPSLQRQAILNMNYGLYEVLPGKIYQVRGFDLANISFIKSDTGWIVFDPLTARETASAALALINEKVEKRPVVAVVYSHTHADHFGGVRGVVDEKDVKSGKVPIIAPDGFLEHAVSENVYAGNAMARRLFFQYGVLMPASPYGHVDQSIGKNVAAGSLGLIAPTRVVVQPMEEITVDGVRMVFQNTPGTEAPSEMNTYFPDYKAFWAAENITGTIHNIYTLRGAPVRDALAWSKYINDALYEFGQEAEVMFASHSWPRFGNARIQEVMRGQRDLYAHMNNQVLHLANQGVTINQVHNVYAPPKSLQQQWYARGYHGSMEHNSRAVINRYLGYWDANPTTLIPLSPEESAPLYVEMMGGAENILARGKELYEQGKYRHAQELLNKLVYAEPRNQAAKDLLADCFEQIGYQQESPSVRNSFLAAAFELRSGIPEGIAPKTLTPDLMGAMTMEMVLDYLGILMDSRKAEGLSFTINLIVPDEKEVYVLELSNETLTNIKGRSAADADLTLTLDKAVLIGVVMGKGSFASYIESGVVKAEGDLGAFEQLKSTLSPFDPLFELMPGTKAAAN
jgi:alkyl sulfatase BDS1-like metallo-beta-lactamase superfamily hydrolase